MLVSLWVNVAFLLVELFGELFELSGAVIRQSLAFRNGVVTTCGFFLDMVDTTDRVGVTALVESANSCPSSFERICLASAVFFLTFLRVVEPQYNPLIHLQTLSRI